MAFVTFTPENKEYWEMPYNPSSNELAIEDYEGNLGILPLLPLAATVVGAAKIIKPIASGVGKAAGIVKGVVGKKKPTVKGTITPQAQLPSAFAQQPAGFNIGSILPIVGIVAGIGLLAFVVFGGKKKR